jgi:hypothetical protein
VSPGDILQPARLYHVEEADTEALVELARQAKRSGWWKGMSESLPTGFSVHLKLESTAYAIRRYDAAGTSCAASSHGCARYPR